MESKHHVYDIGSCVSAEEDDLWIRDMKTRRLHLS